jgi:hypothetical protein
MQRANQPSAQPPEALLIMITAQLLLTADQGSLGSMQDSRGRLHAACKFILIGDCSTSVPVARRHSSRRDALPTTAATANHAGGFDLVVRLS